MSKSIAIFASGSGSNARAIIEYFRNSDIEVKMLLSNKANAGALNHAKEFSIETMVFDRDKFYSDHSVVVELKERGIDLIVLAGFLWLIPDTLVRAFENRILNIHPSLLPAYGGKGMYGHHVHEAVKASGDTHSGMTVHYVNEKYDEGNIIFQAKVELHPDDSAEEIAAKVLKLEHAHYPKVIESVLKSDGI